ncbi:MAG: ATP-grasp domain-containing protein [Candidatus Eisenbacteria bacterium]
MSLDMNVLLLSPGYPPEMPYFTRALAASGAQVLGIGDTPTSSLAPEVRAALADYLQVESLWDEDSLVQAVSQWVRGREIGRVECLWEPGMLVAARLREDLGVPGLTVEQTVPFRDKEEMKRVLDGAGIRTPKHRRCSSVAEVWKAAEEIGYPLIVKPIAGAGSQDTHRVKDEKEMRTVLTGIGHVPVVSVEEFVDGEEYTYDTVSVDGEPAYENIAWYRPRPLVARNEEWVSPQVIALRDLESEHLAGGIAMGRAVLKALGFEHGFTHMEWYRTADGEVVFGEIGARPPGAHQVDQMNYVGDIDVFDGWARAVTGQEVGVSAARKYNVATVYKRARGRGRIARLNGIETLEQHKDAIVWENLLPIGAPRRDWRATLVSDGFVMLRHPDLETTLRIADEVGENVVLFAR